MSKIFLLTSILCHCVLLCRAQDYQIAGTLKNQGNEKIILTYFDGTKTVTNSIESVNGAFILTGPAPEHPVVATLNTGIDRNIYMGEPKRSMFIPVPSLNVVISKNCKLFVTGSAEDIHLANVAGDKLNESFNSLRKVEGKYTIEMLQLQRDFVTLKMMGAEGDIKDVGKKMQDNREALAAVHKAFIKEYPAAFSSIWLLAMTSRDYSPDELKEAFSQLDGQLKSSYIGEQVVAKIKIMSATANGSFAPDFIKKDINGNLLSLSQLRGKYVLIDFWGSWCGPCRASNPHLKELYSMYMHKGFEILGVANEKIKEEDKALTAWKNAVEKDGLTWPQVINNEAIMKIDVVKLYGIEGYPTKILLDKEGRIIGRWLGGESSELDKKLKSIFTN